MNPCCPPGRGCNAQAFEECALSLFRNAAPDVREAAKALNRWELLDAAVTRDAGERERRFRRRAYERSRDRALIALVMRTTKPAPSESSRGHRRRRRPGPQVVRPA